MKTQTEDCTIKDLKKYPCLPLLVQYRSKSSRLGNQLGEANNRIETLQGELDHVTAQRDSLRKSLAARNAFAKRLERQYREALLEIDRLKQTTAYSQDGKAYCRVCQSISDLEKSEASNLKEENDYSHTLNQNL